MKIATFNANSIRARLPIVINWLRNHQPDVLAVQETKVQDPEFPVQAFLDLDYHVVFRGQKSYNGVAVISRKPMTEVRYGLADDDPESGPRLIRGTCCGVHIINTYVPQGRDTESEHYIFKLEWFRRIHHLLRSEYRPDDRVLWVGDLNVAPTDNDVYDPKSLRGHVCFNEELSRLFHEVCSWGLYDVFRKHKPEAGHFTFFDYRMRGALSRNRGWRIDHILATRPLYDLSMDSCIDLEPRRSKDPKPSDHTFLAAEFDI